MLMPVDNYAYSPSSPHDRPDVVCGHHDNCQAKECRWLALTNIYEKFYRSSIYDIGGTCDFWFTYKTEQVGDIFLLHIFAANLNNGDYSVGLSTCNDLSINKKNGHIYLSEQVTIHSFTSQDRRQTYITTYSFTAQDVDIMKNRCLHITVTFPKNTESKLSAISGQDFSMLLDDPIGTDFTIESEDGTQFKVHKIILCSRSDVFKAMLKSETAESQNNCVRLLEACGEDVHAMIEFMYTGTIKDMENVNFSTLLMLADRYNIGGLDRICTMAISRQLTVENAIETLILSDLHSSDVLKLNTLKFIKKNNSVFRGSSFKEITNIQLLKELCQYLAS